MRRRPVSRRPRSTSPGRGGRICRVSRSPAPATQVSPSSRPSERTLAAARRDRLAQWLADRRRRAWSRRIRWRCRGCSSTRASTPCSSVPAIRPRADERRALGELAALVAGVADRRPDLTVVLAGGMGDHLTRSGTRPPAGRGPARAGRRAEGRRRPAGRTSSSSSPCPRRRASLARAGAPGPRRGPGPAHRRRRDRLRRGQPDRGLAGRRQRQRGHGHRRGPERGPRPSRPRRRGRGAGRDVVDVGRGPASPARPVARAADRPVGRCQRRRGRAAHGRRPRGARPAGRMRRLAGPTMPRPTSSSRPVAPGPSLPHRSWPSPSWTCCAVPGRASSPSTTLGLLAPLGAIPDPLERRAMVADLADDMLAPLGTVVTPAGMRAGRNAGTLVVHGDHGTTRLDLEPGALSVVDLPPGSSAVAEFRFRDTVRLGARGRHFAIDVTGGLGGLLVDMRDVPLRLPERADLRGELLASWRARSGTAPRRERRHDDGRSPERALVPGPCPAARSAPRWTRCSRCRRATVAAGRRRAIRSSSGHRSRNGCATRGSMRSTCPADRGSGAPGGRWIGRAAARLDQASDRGVRLRVARSLADRHRRHHRSARDAVRRDRPRRPAGRRHHDPGRRPRACAGSSRSAARPAAGCSSATDGELRSGGLDVGSAGTILVVGSRVDAETLTRARAMGVCGIIVAGLASKERRDFLASEARQRAALHRLPPFAVLVLDGATRRPLAGADPGGPCARWPATRWRSSPTRRCSSSTGRTWPSRRRRSTSSASVPARCRAARASSSRPSARAGSPGGVHLEAGPRPAPGRHGRAAVPLGDLERFV